MEQNTNVDIQWSSNKMEGCEVLKTMECLRRRLLAERQASLLAKEEAELMGKRSTELAKQITEQIQMKTKADNKLQLLRKKLQSLNLSPAKVNSEPSNSSEIRDEDEPKTLTAASSLPGNPKNIGKISDSQVENPNAPGSTSLSSSASEIFSDEPSETKIENGGEEFDSGGDSLAIVAVKSPEKEEISELKPVINERIIEVLNDLKLARERIQRSMEICELNMMMRVSPI